MRIKNLKNNKGFTAIDAAIGVVILAIGISALGIIVYNTLNQVDSTQKNSVATFYAVQVLEKINELDYNDVYLAEGTATSTGTNKIIGLNVSEEFTVTLNIQNYNSTAGNTDKQDLIKIIDVTVSYEDNELEKNINIKTLKKNM